MLLLLIGCMSVLIALLGRANVGGELLLALEALRRCLVRSIELLLGVGLRLFSRRRLRGLELRGRLRSLQARLRSVVVACLLVLNLLGILLKLKRIVT